MEVDEGCEDKKLGQNQWAQAQMNGNKNQGINMNEPWTRGC